MIIAASSGNENVVGNSSINVEPQSIFCYAYKESFQNSPSLQSRDDDQQESACYSSILNHVTCFETGLQ